MRTTERLARVVVVEDNPMDARLVGEALASSGVACDITLLEDGEEALNYMEVCRRGGAPDLVILDLNIPRYNGLEVLAQYRADATMAGVPVVVLSSSDSPVEKRRAELAGASGFLQKPLRLAEFLALGEQFKAFLEAGPVQA